MSAQLSAPSLTVTKIWACEFPTHLPFKPCSSSMFVAQEIIFIPPLLDSETQISSFESRAISDRQNLKSCNVILLPNTVKQIFNSLKINQMSSLDTQSPVWTGSCLLLWPHLLSFSESLSPVSPRCLLAIPHTFIEPFHLFSLWPHALLP